MSLKTTVRSINNAVDQYENLLSKVTEEEFTATPAEGVWSYAEVYSHIFRSNLLGFTAIERCSAGQGIEDNTPTKWKYRLVLFFKRFPPNIKLKVPAKLAHLVEKINKEEARKLINDFRQKMISITEQVKTSSPTQKIKHPRMELLNAEQWLIFTDIHTMHHARQLKRITKLFKEAKS